ncbi:CDP-diacylglycerol--glycerol-3-phosphate 3-phosphatidyltransferase [Actinoalloteichus hymeniacidonis]|uniref:CDP-diacylglycerol--glycerol-3-phosphate 3-phosphatidyltransferase n=1 Tax=Actinoalloteichus hymeniacidonis TaxID=340345 RepID=A0AAC9HQF3_9PSEU|nr:CDP-diacylglycerol--glycerol-3-phosphate 3-phosphatidyltransferase [Actinoalloteichus hymeniacidonis]AOS62690.1 CDP-diacylglycerol--glycerol-3-phosphate 3-phosphatidyltransferase [Actinoalloteichus hymeniacidonis]MBB5909279.1 CDP-diacylglycerol--glycerol-3-phosphate 3-phosphatidyltransferase [Actinoalloteichus hymeniacidonis]
MTAAADDAVEPTPAPTPVPVVNIANALTVFRLLLVPVFLFALLGDHEGSTTWRLLATGIFLLAAATDRLDGDLARKRGLITDFGKIADPIADKTLIGAALIGLSMLGDLPWWVTGTILARELGVTLLRFWVIRHGVIPASRGGKAKTLVQIVAIVLLLLPLPASFAIVVGGVMAVAVLLTLITGLDYAVRAVKMRARGRRATAGAP